MRLLIFSLLSLICSSSFAQKSTLKLNLDWILLTGNQTVYKYNPPGMKERYKQTYVWPESTYTLFRISEDKKKVYYYGIKASTVLEAKKKFTKTVDILKYVMNMNKPEHVIEYEILDILEPVKGIDGKYIMGKLYTLKLNWQTKEQANTTIEIRDGKIRYGSKNLGKPYHVRYPVLYNDFFINLKDW